MSKIKAVLIIWKLIRIFMLNTLKNDKHKHNNYVNVTSYTKCTLNIFMYSTAQTQWHTHLHACNCAQSKTC